MFIFLLGGGVGVGCLETWYVPCPASSSCPVINGVSPVLCALGFAGSIHSAVAKESLRMSCLKKVRTRKRAGSIGEPQ